MRVLLLAVALAMALTGCEPSREPTPEECAALGGHVEVRGHRRVVIGTVVVLQAIRSCIVDPPK